MVRLTQSLKQWMFDNHKEILPLLLLGHVELFTDEAVSGVDAKRCKSALQCFSEQDCLGCEFSVRGLYPICGNSVAGWDFTEKPKFTDEEKWDANHLVHIFGNSHITVGRNDIGEAYVIAHRNVGCGNGLLINKNLFPSIKNGGKFSVSEILGDTDA